MSIIENLASLAVKTACLPISVVKDVGNVIEGDNVDDTASNVESILDDIFG
jgi:hypothetical protein